MFSKVKKIFKNIIKNSFNQIKNLPFLKFIKSLTFLIVNFNLTKQMFREEGGFWKVTINTFKDVLKQMKMEREEKKANMNKFERFIYRAKIIAFSFCAIVIFSAFIFVEIDMKDKEMLTGQGIVVGIVEEKNTWKEMVRFREILADYLYPSKEINIIVIGGEQNGLIDKVRVWERDSNHITIGSLVDVEYYKVEGEEKDRYNIVHAKMVN